MYSGHDIFKLVDTYGLPLDIIILELRDKHQAFNVAEFIESAIKANWTDNRIFWMLKTESEKFNLIINWYIEYFKNEKAT